MMYIYVDNEEEEGEQHRRIEKVGRRKDRTSSTAY
jgi:hypothetical protein